MSERLQITQQDSVHWEIPPEFKGIISYNPRHDIQDFLDLANLQGKIPPEDFAQLQTQIVGRTKRQLVKTLGERFRVRSSQTEYYIEGETLLSPDYPEPVLNRYQKAIEFLVQEGSTETLREEAEIEGLRKIENIFAKKTLRPNEKIVIVSPRGPKGTLYSDNYFDVHEQVGDRIITTRYHSTHTYKKFLEAAKAVDSSFPEPQDNLNAAFFLKNPIPTTMPIDRLLETFGLDLDTQLERTNQDIVTYCEPYLNYYIRVLIENPLNINELKKTLNTIYNIADKAKRESEQQAHTKDQPTVTRQPGMRKIQDLPIAVVMQNIGYYGNQPVRTVSNGCPGGQKGFSVNQPTVLKSLAVSIGAQSIVDFAPYLTSKSEEVVDFQCPGTKDDGTKCTYMVRAYSGVSKCPECGMEATCA